MRLPPALFAFDGLRRFDLSDLLAARVRRPVLVAAPIDGDRQPLTVADAQGLLKTGRFRWPELPSVAVGHAADQQLRRFMAKRAGVGDR